ncbi:Ig-like domain-containing protein [Colwellia sp. E150_009]
MITRMLGKNAIKQCTCLFFLLLLLGGISNSVYGFGATNGNWVSSGGIDYRSINNPRYQFSLSSAKNVQFEVSAVLNGGFHHGIHLFLLNANGVVIQEKRGGVTGTNGASVLTQFSSNIQAGIYTLVVGTKRDSESGTFSISTSDTTLQRMSARITGGSWVSSGGTDYRSVDNPRYKFSLSAARNVRLDVTSIVQGYNYGVRLYLLDENGSIIKQQQGGSTGTHGIPVLTLFTMDLQAGDYTLIMGTKRDDVEGTYTISTFDLDSPLIKNTPKKTNGNWVSSGGSDYRSVDNPRYKFSLSSTRNIQLEISSTVQGYNYGVHLYLLNSSGAVIKQQQGSSTGTHGIPVLTLFTMDLQAGDYTLVMGTKRDDVEGSYSISTFDIDTSLQIQIPLIKPVVSINNLKNSFDVNWNTINTANNYIVEYQLENGSWQLFGNYTVNSINLSGLLTGQYTFRVAACEVDFCSLWSVVNEQSMINVPQSPQKPSVNVSTLDNGLISLTINSDGKAENHQIRYENTFSPISDHGEFNINSTSRAQHHTVADLVGGEYVFWVSSCNVNGCSEESTVSQSVVQKPPVIANVSAEIQNYNVLLNWTVNNVGQHHIVEYSRDGDNFLPLGTTSSGLSYDTPDLLAGSYEFNVKSCLKGVCNTSVSISNIAFIPVPTVPSCINSPDIAANNKDFLVGWCDATNEHRYELYEENLGLIYSGNANQAMQNIVDGVYSFKVRACNDVGCSNFTNNAVTEVLEIFLPANVASLDITDEIYEVANYELTWPQVIGTVDYYEISQTNNGITSVHQVTSGFEYSVSLDVGSYDFTVKACNIRGCSKEGTEKSVVVNEALAGNVFLNNAVNSQGYPQSTDLDFYLNWPEISDATQYQVSYQYIDFEGQQQTVHNYIAGMENQLDITLPEDASNGLIIFYLTEYSNNQPTETRKVVGYLHRRLSTPMITSFTNDSNIDWYFNVAWTPVDYADFYTVIMVFHNGVSKVSGHSERVYATSKRLSVGSFPSGENAQPGVITVYVVAHTENRVIQESLNSMPEELKWRTSDTGGAAPQIVSITPNNNQVLSLDDPVKISAVVQDDGSIDKVIFKISGDVIGVLLYEDKTAPYEADFTANFNGSMFGSYHVEVKAYDDFGKTARENISLSRNKNALPTPTIQSITKLSDGNYKLEWTGSENAIYSSLAQTSTKEYGGFIHDYRIMSGDIVISHSNDSKYYYIFSCYSTGNTCSPRTYSDFFQLKNTTSQPSLISIKTELLGTALETSTNN